MEIMTDETAKIFEIFQSIQGEGKYIGVKQIFVRFFGCHMHCQWCDTPNAIGDTTSHYKEMTIDDIVSRIHELNNHCHSVSFTGGEPLLQATAIKKIVPLLKKTKLKSFLETSGTHPEELLELIDQLDIISMDLKLPSSTRCREYWSEHEAFLRIAVKREVYLKIVITCDTSMDDIKRATELIVSVDNNLPLFLQPNFFDMKNGVMDVCLTYKNVMSEYLTDIRIVPQVHKFLKVP